MIVRPATPADLPAIAAIYGHQAETGIATFDSEPVPVEQWAERLGSVGPGHRLLVAEEAGLVQGYAASAAWRPRPAYRHTRETSVYLADSARGRGVGRALYDALLAQLREDGMRLAVAVVALPNDASVALHLACGFTSVGVLHEVGHKLGRWVDTELFELRLVA
jgi:phosphinothricin acetyltransferase